MDKSVKRRLETMADLELENKRLRDAFAALSVQRDEAEEHGRNAHMTTRLLQFDVATMARDGRGITWVGLSLDDFAALRTERAMVERFSVAPLDPASEHQMTLATPSGLLRVSAVAGLPSGVIAQLRQPMLVPNATKMHAVMGMNGQTMVRLDFAIEPKQAIRYEVG